MGDTPLLAGWADESGSTSPRDHVEDHLQPIRWSPLCELGPWFWSLRKTLMRKHEPGLCPMPEDLRSCGVFSKCHARFWAHFRRASLSRSARFGGKHQLLVCSNGPSRNCFFFSPLGGLQPLTAGKGGGRVRGNLNRAPKKDTCCNHLKHVAFSTIIKGHRH